MGVYIPKITIPRRCGDCLFFGTAPSNDAYCWLGHHSLPLTGIIPKDCPLVEVKPHGRLIDADAAVKQGWKINRTYSASPNEMVYEVKTMDDEVLPTIIPADESDMDSFIHIFEGDDEEDGMDSFIRILKD